MRAAMAMAMGLAAVLSGCWGDDAWILEGVVIDVNAPEGAPPQIVVDHEEVPGLMGPMVMPFRLEGPAVSVPVARGDRIVARLRVKDGRSYLEKLRVTGKAVLPERAEAPAPLRPGEQLDAVDVPLADGATWTVGAGQGTPTLLTFLYTTCPIPEFCPAIAARLGALQGKVAGRARLLAVTVDPAGDTPEVLRAYAATVGADPAVWRFGRVAPEVLTRLAGKAALGISPEGDEVIHNLRALVLDADGRLIERYDDARFPVERVASQLLTGGPTAPAGSDGTVTPAP